MKNERRYCNACKRELENGEITYSVKVTGYDKGGIDKTHMIELCNGCANIITKAIVDMIVNIEANTKNKTLERQ